MLYRYKHPIIPREVQTKVRGVLETGLLPLLPQVGDIRRGTEIGLKDAKHQYQWSPCQICRKARWAVLLKGEPRRNVCYQCSLSQKGEKARHWQGGKYVDKSGYVCVYIPSNSPFHLMSHGGKHATYEHRLIMAQHLGRCLESWEIVHHKNGVKSDNRLDNLLLVDARSHDTNYSDGFQYGYNLGYEQGMKDALQI